MTTSDGRPVGDRPQSEFTISSGGFGRVLAPFAAPLVVFFVVLMLLGSLSGSLAVGVLVGVIGTAILVGVFWAKFRRMQSRTTISFSERGVHLVDSAGFEIRLAWGDIVSVGPVDSRMASRRPAGVGTGLRVAAGAVQTIGLIGWGERTTPGRDSVERDRSAMGAGTRRQLGTPVPTGLVRMTRTYVGAQKAYV